MVGDWALHPTIKLSKNVLVIDVKEQAASIDNAQKELSPITPLLVKANIENGQTIFKKCAQCHTIESGKPHIQGPNLFGVIGRHIASVVDYAYSSALKEKTNMTWDVEQINHFIYKPREFAKGTKMTFAGLEKDQDRADVIAYIQSKMKR